MHLRFRSFYDSKLIRCCSWVPVGLCVRLVRWRVRPWLLHADGRERVWLSRAYTVMGYLATSFLVVYGHASYFVSLARRFSATSGGATSMG